MINELGESSMTPQQFEREFGECGDSFDPKHIGVYVRQCAYAVFNHYEAENKRLRGMLEECKTYLRDFRTKHEVLARNTNEGTDLQGWYISEYRKADDLLERMDNA